MRRFRIGAPLLALLLCLTGVPQGTLGIQGDNSARKMLQYTVGNCVAPSVAQAEERGQGGEVFLDGVAYLLEDGVAYAVDYLKDTEIAVAPQHVNGLPVSFERIGFRQSDVPKLMLAEGITKVTERQFFGVSASELVLPSTLREIGDYAFSFISNLKTLTIPEGVTSIGASAFSYCDTETLSLPSTAVYIAPSAFSSCANLRSILVHPDNPKYTAIDGALYSKDGKTLYCFPAGYGNSWTMPDGTEAIDGEAFGYNRKLQTLTIGTGVRVLPESVFTSCEALRTVRLSSTVETIMDWALPLHQLKALEVPTENPFFKCVNGTMYDMVGGVLIFHPRGADVTFSVLPGTKRIGARAFSGDDALRSVSLPLGLEEICDSAFGGCTALESVSLPLTVTRIGEYAFGNCIVLERLALPPGLVSIGSGAFYNCASIPALHIPPSVKEVEDSAFSETPQMTITAQAGTVGEMYARTGKEMADPLGAPYQTEPAVFTYNPVFVGIVNNPGTDDLLPLYEREDTASAILGSYPNGTTMIIRSEYGEWTSVFAGDTDGFVKTSGLMRTDLFYTLYRPVIVEVRAARADLMAVPLAAGTVLEQMEGGMTLDVSAACGTWYQVLVNGQIAYVPTNLVSVVQYENLSGGEQYGVVENPNPRDRLHLRDKPSRDGKSLTRFFNGTQVEIIEEKGDWYRVRVAGMEGYMMADYVSKVFNQ